MRSFVKFPSTPHLTVLEGASVRDDKVLSVQERDQFLSHEVVIEEKIDGANLGLSFDGDGNLLAQNRGSYIEFPPSGQWKPLTSWIDDRRDRLFDVLTNRFVLFGEWCFATHSVFYDRLPDWFVGFDLFDSQAKRFVNSETRHEMLALMNIHLVPQLADGCWSLGEALMLLQESRFGSAPAEGLYLRFDGDDWLEQRAKIVRPDFIQSIEQHWTRRPLQQNRLATATEPSSSKTERDW